MLYFAMFNYSVHFSLNFIFFIKHDNVYHLLHCSTVIYIYVVYSKHFPQFHKTSNIVAMQGIMPRLWLGGSLEL